MGINDRLFEIAHHYFLDAMPPVYKGQRPRAEHSFVTSRSNLKQVQGQDGQDQTRKKDPKGNFSKFFNLAVWRYGGMAIT